MKRCADLTAKSVSLSGEAISNRKNLKSAIIAIGTTFLVCGFFYTLFSVNSLPRDKKIDLFADSNRISRQMLPQAFLVAHAKNSSTNANSLCSPDFLEKNSRENQLDLAPELCKNALLQNESQLTVTEKVEEDPLRQYLEELLYDTPMEEMIDPLLLQEKQVAAFLVGIAFKESKFGVYSPQKNGVTCFNYWGFKGKRNPNRSGYSCFSSPEEAVAVVGKRLEKLAIKQKRSTPAQMTIWKCGSSCASHSPQSVSKWISDVNIHYSQIMSIDI